MTDAATVKSIITNLETIVSTTIGWRLEDLSSDPVDQDIQEVRSIVLAQIYYDGEEFEDNFNERKATNEISVTIKAEKTVLLPGDARDTAVDLVHAIRTNVTVANLNTGDLASSKLVHWVRHSSATVDRIKLKTIMTYQLKIRYAEL